MCARWVLHACRYALRAPTPWPPGSLRVGAYLSAQLRVSARLAGCAGVLGAPRTGAPHPGDAGLSASRTAAASPPSQPPAPPEHSDTHTRRGLRCELLRCCALGGDLGRACSSEVVEKRGVDDRHEAEAPAHIAVHLLQHRVAPHTSHLNTATLSCHPDRSSVPTARVCLVMAMHIHTPTSASLTCTVPGCCPARDSALAVAFLTCSRRSWLMDFPEWICVLSTACALLRAPQPSQDSIVEWELDEASRRARRYAHTDYRSTLELRCGRLRVVHAAGVRKSSRIWR